MIQIAILVAALACQTPPPKDPFLDWSAPNSETPAPAPSAASPSHDVGILGYPKMPEMPPIAPRTGEDWRSRGGADLFCGVTFEGEAAKAAECPRPPTDQEAAAKAAESPPPPADDSGYHCRRTATSLTCGTDEEAMRRIEEKAKALLDQMLSPD